MYTLKQIPEDFIVDEVQDFEENKENVLNSDKGKYSVYLMKKTNYNTEDAVQELCRHLNIQRKNIGYAGLKDRNAITSQYISILGKGKEINLKDLSLHFVGFRDSPISLGNLKGNNFKITIRNISDEQAEEVICKVSLTKEFVNYFDSQRFSKNNAEIGKLILKKKYKEVCELILSENSKNSEQINNFLETRKNAYLNAIKLLPKKTIMIYVHAYQSLLWNRAVKELISKQDLPEYVQLLGFGTELKESEKEIYEEILSSEEITLRDFILRDFPEISLEGDSRKVYVELKDLTSSSVKDDELNEGMKKIVLSFFLNKGAYATMAVKNIVGEIEDIQSGL